MRKGELIYNVLICCSVLLIAASSIYAFLYFKRLFYGEKVYQEIQEEYTVNDPSTVIPVDFAALQKKNPDIYAWIRLKGTTIDYPVLQSSTSDSFYLQHTVEKDFGYPGAIYTEKANSKDFSDFNTVIYGHNMKDGSMFGCLQNLINDGSFASCGELLIYTPNCVRHYKIFAAYVYDHRHLLNSFDLETPKGRTAYLKEVFAADSSSAQYDHSVSVDADDKIVTLSTCMSNANDERYLVQGVLTEIETGQ